MLKRLFVLYFIVVANLCATEYDCIELYGDYRVVIKGTKNEARNVSSKRYVNKFYCEEDLKAYLSRHQ